MNSILKEIDSDGGKLHRLKESSMNRFLLILPSVTMLVMNDERYFVAFCIYLK